MQKELIKLEYIYGTKKRWRVLEDTRVVLSNGTLVIIPKGMETDLSSVPRFLWGLFPPFGDFLIASLVHDYMYIYDLGRKRADEEMLYLSNKYNKNKIDNYLRYLAVRLFGGFVY